MLVTGDEGEGGGGEGGGRTVIGVAGGSHDGRGLEMKDLISFYRGVKRLRKM